MKSTSITKKNNSAQKRSKIKHYQFWIVLFSAALVGVWFMFLVLGFFGATALINAAAEDSSSEVYGFFLSFSLIFAVFLAAAVSIPFALAVYKRLKIQKPVLSAIAFFMALTFGMNLFALVIRIQYFETGPTYAILAASMIFAGLLYGFVVRPLKHRVSTAGFLAVSIGLAVLPIAAWYLFYL